MSGPPDTADSLAARLDLLRDILGTSVGLRDPSEVAAPAAPKTARRDEPSWEQLQATAEPSWEQRQATSETSWEQLQATSLQSSITWGFDAPAKRDAGDSRRPASLAEEGIGAAAPLDRSSLVVGETVGEAVDFCPWKAIVAYPTTFIGKTNRPRARPFFDQILADRTWDFFYLHDPNKPGEKPQLLVPTAQFEDFLQGVNQQLGIALTIPPGVNRERFCLKFGRGGTPRPRYLFPSSGTQSLERQSWPEILESDVVRYTGASRKQRERFDRLLSRMLASQVSCQDATRRAEERAAKRAMDRRAMMRQTQAHLGIGDGSGDGRGVVFVCVDIEAIEVPPHPISEVGIAILDTSRINRVQPGPAGSVWWRFIEAHHFRTTEYAALINWRHVQGCPGAFDFGTSVPVPKDMLADAFRLTLELYVERGRQLVLVGHDIKQDIRYLSSIGVEILDTPRLLGEIDTKDLHQAWNDTSVPRGLGAVLADLHIPSTHLHNAGNDAVYTLRAMIGLAIEQQRKDEAAAKGEDYVPALW